tara:strand:- start:13438 stop:13986 length:549 start_codon:yes stop_codon:yes gene_type:complete
MKLQIHIQKLWGYNMTQKIVSNKALGTGVAGEFYSTEPQRTRGKILTSASEALNLIGVALTQVAGEEDQAGVAASGVFAGILGSPKSLQRVGLDAQTVVPNGTAVECILQGYVVVNLPAAANIGDFVYYSDTTGLLATAAPAASTPAGHSRVSGGTVQIRNVAGAGLGIIYLDAAGDSTEPA